jgi:hypothetical protein
LDQIPKKPKSLRISGGFYIYWELMEGRYIATNKIYWFVYWGDAAGIAMATVRVPKNGKTQLQMDLLRLKEKVGNVIVSF